LNAKEYNIAVDQFADNIYRFALKHLKNEMSAKDIVQDTFLKVWDKHETISFEKVKSYLFTTAYHSIIDWIKKERRSADFDLVDASLASEKTAEFDLKETLEKALNTLPEIQKTVIMWREIAEITSLNESQVKVYIFRGRQQLKTYLKDRELVA
jgi:RNA polymerase sigma factor (sigma-70 family)